ncbi:hypothetical protein VHEMI03197 [[Torrubiella] hemipterigena]|uniref:RNase H type-1 domain-containing protein n=1 Tax=[Torrubiella] hemipterigena TaxID=1531966 RepID=A0A0A1SXY1_9HYPO|nr:hypothetical protein VHEMI03197 [[Torrubiella] hemipterigena]
MENLFHTYGIVSRRMEYGIWNMEYGIWNMENSIHTRMDRKPVGYREVFDAEITGALSGLKHALHLDNTRPITICVDNSAVVRGIGGTAPMSSRSEFLDFQAIGDRLPGRVTVRWTPGHKDIPGNEAADALAKKGAAKPLRELPPSIAQRKREVKGLLPQLFKRWWDTVQKDTYQHMGLKADLNKHPELALPRTKLRYLLAARSHHGDFAAYHQRFHHDGAPLECSCGHEKTPTHLFYCRKVPISLRARLAPDDSKAIGRYLGTEYGVFCRIAEVYFKYICPYR